MKTSGVSTQTKHNWLVDAGLFISALVAGLSGIYFLYLPKGGYEGGRNPFYGVVILFERHTWEDLHTWTGIAMILIAIYHLIRHWSWVVNMSHKLVKEITGRDASLNAHGRWNLILNMVVGLSFLLSGLSGLYFYFFPSGGGAVDPMIIFSSFTWDLVHTWAGVLLIAAAVLHFAIHWKWVTKVTSNMLTRSTRRSVPNIANNQIA